MDDELGGRRGARLLRRRVAALAAVGVLGLGAVACSSDDDGSADGSAASDGGSASGGDLGGLTQGDAQAFKEAAMAGTTEGEAYVDCLGEAVVEGVQRGEITAQDVRDWYEGSAPTGPVQDLISQPDLVMSCMQADGGASATSAP